MKAKRLERLILSETGRCDFHRAMIRFPVSREAFDAVVAPLSGACRSVSFRGGVAELLVKVFAWPDLNRTARFLRRIVVALRRRGERVAFVGRSRSPRDVCDCDDCARLWRHAH